MITLSFYHISSLHQTGRRTHLFFNQHKLSALKAVFERPILRGDTFLLTGTLPVATTEEFKRSLHAFSEGEGVFLTKPSGFRKIENAFPTRKRSDYNPLNRKDYMLHILHAY